jgi:hypothetical protein
MANVFYNGLHWVSPVDNAPGHNPRAQQVYNAGQGFKGCLIIADWGNGNPNNWADAANFVKNNAKRPSEMVLRLFWPDARGQGSCNLPGTGPELATIFYNNIVDTAVRAYNIRNFVIMNELNLEYEGLCGGRVQLVGYMYNVAYHLKRQAHSAGTYPIYLGFPGPGGVKFSDADWAAYWDAYKPTITQPLDFVGDYAYNWLSPHVYGLTRSECLANLKGAYNDLRSRIPRWPQRYTEWSIPKSDANRIPDMVTVLQKFRAFVQGIDDVDVYALHAYISGRSNAAAGGTDYNITISEGEQLANVF